jgi:hypothetical protein
MRCSWSNLLREPDESGDDHQQCEKLPADKQDKRADQPALVGILVPAGPVTE